MRCYVCHKNIDEKQISIEEETFKIIAPEYNKHVVCLDCFCDFASAKGYQYFDVVFNIQKKSLEVKISERVKK